MTAKREQNALDVLTQTNMCVCSQKEEWQDKYKASKKLLNQGDITKAGFNLHKFQFERTVQLR